MSDEYFVRRVAPQPPDYEDAYWGTVTDPDGRVRDRLQEREKHLADVAQELSFINHLPPGRLLDVGCGLGYLLSGVDPHWERHGVEISQFAAERAAQWGRVFVGDLVTAGYAAHYFDVVVLHHVIEHVSDPVALLREIKRVLRPDGYLILGTPDFDSGAARRFGAKYRLLHDHTHISLFSNDSMHRCLRDLGFIIERVEYPFFETRYFTPENLQRLFDTSQISPPFYGNFMTFYARKPVTGAGPEALAETGQALLRAATALAAPSAAAAAAIARRLAGGGQWLLLAATPLPALPALAAGVRVQTVEPEFMPAQGVSSSTVVLSQGIAVAASLPLARSAGALAVYLGPDKPNLADNFDIVLTWPTLDPAWEAGLRAALWDGLLRDVASRLTQAPPPQPLER